LTAEDCDDTDPLSTIVAEDSECDGVIDCLSTTTAQGATFIRMCGDTFDMGCTAGQSGCQDDEDPVRSVTITQDFWMAETEATQAQWSALMGTSHGNAVQFSGGPLHYVSWYDALALANALSVAEGLAECFALTGCTNVPWSNQLQCTGATVNTASGSPYDCEGYRLPTEAEWELAARAGTDFLYSGGDVADDVAWYSANHTATNRPEPVATKLSNSWGLYDMSGNVAEWTWDWYDETYYTTGVATDPEGPATGTSRVRRGGGWNEGVNNLRVADRSVYFTPSNYSGKIGFRLARTVP